MQAIAQGVNTAALEEKAALRAGRVLDDRWWLERLLHVDLLGSTYAAISPQGVRVNLTLMHSELAHSAPLRLGFVDTAQLGTLVGHPDAVRLLEDGETKQGLVFFTTEPVEGELVSELIARRPGRVPPAEALRIVHDTLGVLIAAHERGIIHGALRPEHLLLTENGTVRVAGFGTAALEAAAARELGSPLPLSLAAFVSPEQARQGWLSADERSDCWATGAVLFSLLTGQAVRSAEVASDLLDEAGRYPIRSLAELIDDPPTDLVRLLERALELDRGRRFASARRMREAVGHATDNPCVAGLLRLRTNKPPPRIGRWTPPEGRWAPGSEFAGTVLGLLGDAGNGALPRGEPGISSEYPSTESEANPAARPGRATGGTR
jgi:serine/threonine protein kinase